MVTDKPAPITVALAQLEKSDKRAPAHSVLLQLNTLPDDVLGAGSNHTPHGNNNVAATDIPSNGDTIKNDGNIVVDGSVVKSKGWETE